ncbi:facilitated trehalose transporter Tret1-like [Amphibalanus amphitrite]|uniref:facilitated trehalose transporter Tret1-like n=1 Tax=Amphibalanus amphitrite TaxID=1232801 RepID=UPI001C912B57|nr:facilitated trehalose transporter Tret1-like [Amphibalanus amphitrite]
MAPRGLLSTCVWHQLLTAAAATFGGCPVGLALGYTSSALPQLRDSPLHVTDQQGSLVGSMVPLGALLAAPLAGSAMQALGRRSALVLVSLPAVLGWLLVTYAGSLTVLLLGRLLTGAAVGWTTVVVPTYLAEVTTARLRGPAGAVFELQLNVGVLLSYVVGKYADWRLLATLCGAVSALWLLLVTLSCQSPLWLAQRGRLAEARATLRWLRGELADVESELAALGTGRATGKAALSELRRPEHRRPLALALFVVILQKACGNNVITFYATDIFVEAGGSMDSSTAAIYCGLTKVLTTALGVAAVHSRGRKPLLVASSVITGASLVVLGIFFRLKDTGQDVSAIEWLPLTSIVVFLLGFGIGFGPITYLYMGEILPPDVKNLASSIAIFFNWGTSFLTTLTFEPLEDAISPAGTFWMYACLCLIGAVILQLTLVETRGKTLEQIQQHFDSGKDVEPSDASSQESRGSGGDLKG